MLGRAVTDSQVPKKRRQAVLLIHGIGEQRPMSTLRGFVSALVNDGRFRSKPDDLSLSFELRRLTHDDPDKNLQTCFFEYYWAFHMRDTGIRHLYDWGKRLLGSRNVPPRLKLMWRLGRAAALIAACGVLLAVVCLGIYIVVLLLGLGGLVPAATRESWQQVTEAFSAVGTLVALIFTALSGFIIYVLGDTARYLHSAPDNVAERQAIRHDGIELLRRLHEVEKAGRPKYDRIIVVGHSLGSVIGYDILSFYWAAVNERLPIYDVSKLKALDDSITRLKWSFRSKNNQCRKAAESFLSAQENFRTTQNEIWNEFRPERWDQLAKQYSQGGGHALDGSFPETCPWRITDFVTLGSPLTYAGFLFATSDQDLARRKSDRELPCAPPVTEQRRCWYDFYTDELPKKLHHAALFALTRWTNFYFAADMVGGPLSHSFGPAIQDRLCSPLGVRDILGLRSHVGYWLGGDKHHRPAHIAELRDIIFNRPWETPCLATSHEPNGEPTGSTPVNI